MPFTSRIANFDEPDVAGDIDDPELLNSAKGLRAALFDLQVAADEGDSIDSDTLESARESIDGMAGVCTSDARRQPREPTAERSPNADEPADDSATDLFVRTMRSDGVIPTYGDEAAVVELTRELCDRYDQGDDFADVRKAWASDGIDEQAAIQINSAAPIVFCPEHVGR